jgi:hypothetical protein
VSQTNPPAAATTRLSIRSLRVQSQTERTLASPSRWRTSSRAATALATKPNKPSPVMTVPSGGAPDTARQTAKPRMNTASSARLAPFTSAAPERTRTDLPMAHRLMA